MCIRDRNNAWPGLIWHLYDWYLRPGGSYFGAKKANEPLHVQYSYDDRSIVVVNSYYKPFPGVKVHAAVYNLDMTEKFARDAMADIAEDSAPRVLTLPDKMCIRDSSRTVRVGGEVRPAGRDSRAGMGRSAYRCLLYTSRCV